MLNHDEEEALGRINVLSQFGELPESMQSRFEELRARDVRLEIPEPTLDVQLLPRQRGRDDALDDALCTVSGDADPEFAASRLYLVRDF